EEQRDALVVARVEPGGDAFAGAQVVGPVVERGQRIDLGLVGGGRSDECGFGRAHGASSTSGGGWPGGGAPPTGPLGATGPLGPTVTWPAGAGITTAPGGGRPWLAAAGSPGGAGACCRSGCAGCGGGWPMAPAGIVSSACGSVACIGS